MGPLRFEAGAHPRGVVDRNSEMMLFTWRCPLYPKSGHSWVSSECLLWANSGHPRHLFDHLVGAGEHARRHGEAERLGRFEIDQQFVLVSACTGTSPGFSPLRIRSTKPAARRYWSVKSAAWEKQLRSSWHGRVELDSTMSALPRRRTVRELDLQSLGGETGQKWAGINDLLRHPGARFSNITLDEQSCHSCSAAGGSVRMGLAKKGALP